MMGAEVGLFDKTYAFAQTIILIIILFNIFSLSRKGNLHEQHNKRKFNFDRKNKFKFIN